MLGVAGRRIRAAHRDDGPLGVCRDRFKTVLVPNQIAADGSFPLELRRTKPYGYSLFNLDAFATTASSSPLRPSTCGPSSCRTAADSGKRWPT